MSAQDLVDRLDHCKQAGKGKWVARCPSHDDRGPSLSIREESDGRVLIHCFAGCSPLDVITSVGLDWGSLFPPELEHCRARRNKPASESVDSLVIEIVEHDRALGKRLSKVDIARYKDALKRKPVEGDTITEIAYEIGAVK